MSFVSQHPSQHPRTLSITLAVSLAFCGALVCQRRAAAQATQQSATTQSTKQAPAKPVTEPAKNPAVPAVKPQNTQAAAGKNIKPEDLVERAIFAYGSRPILQAIQKNGTLRANVKFFAADGERQGRTVSKFMRKPKLEEDLLLIDLDLPGTRYLLGFDGKQTWSINNGEVQPPSPETVKAFRAAHEHSYEALLRYKENDGKLELVGNNKLGPIEMDVVELTLPSGTKTRYEISRRTGRIIYVNYEEKPTPDAPPVKYRLYFKDFRVIQNTLVPYSIRVYADDKVIEERSVVEAAYNVQMDEKNFLAENALKPAEAAKQ